MHMRSGDAAGRYWKEKVKQTLRCTRVLSAFFSNILRFGTHPRLPLCSIGRNVHIR